MKIITFGMLCGLAIGCNQAPPPVTTSGSTGESSTTVTAQRPLSSGQPVDSTEPVDRTNTGVNVRDRQDIAKTPIDQNENTSDIQITADIRKQVVATKMAVNAQNVKIITQDGKVTLRGPVQTAEEKQRIEEIATSVAGDNKVDSQLEVNND
mgnify:CR=1 FL=1